MTFDSIIFALFLPLVFVLHQLLGKCAHKQNLLLLAASYLFYGWWDWRFLGLIVFTTCISFGCAWLIDKSQTENKPRLATVANVLNCVLNIGILGIFKYYDFFVSSLNELLIQVGYNGSWPLLHLLLPVGISFYTFQSLSYTIDVYRGTLRAERNWLTYATYLAFFPQLVAGPIERASNLLPQFRETRLFCRKKAITGCRLMLWGFFKKLVIADNCAEIVEKIFVHYDTIGGSALLYGAIIFAFQIYADFSGYSDIAIGTARLFGIRLSQNFDNPYFAISIPDFWRRWHISLTSWFRDYVYIPLGGSRKGCYRTLLNTLIVFTLSGLWHGANWTFLLWGFYHGLLFTPWVMGWVKRDKQLRPSLPQHLPQMLLTFLLICIGWILFRAENLGMALTCLRRIICCLDFSFLEYSKSILLFVAFMLAAEWGQRPLPRQRWARWAIYYLLIAFILWKGTVSSRFIYFQF